MAEQSQSTVGEALVQKVMTLTAENERLRAGIDEALAEIHDAGPKALKYAEQALLKALNP